MSWTPLIAVDFDGVLHNYDGKWAPSRVVGDAVPGAMDFLVELYLSERYDVAITSARSRYILGRWAMRQWLREQLIRHCGYQAGPYMDPLYLEVFEWIKWPWFKPGALLYIDDRAHCFSGEFPTIPEIKAFKPWNRKDK